MGIALIALLSGVRDIVRRRTDLEAELLALLSTTVSDEARLTSIGKAYQEKYGHEIVSVYFFKNANKATATVPDVMKASVMDDIPFVYQSNPFTGHTELVNYQKLNKESRVASPSAEGKTKSQRALAEAFFHRHKAQGVLSVKIYGDVPPPAAIFMDVTIEKRVGRKLLKDRSVGTATARAWLDEFRNFCRREHRSAGYCTLTIASDGDEIINANQHMGVTFP
jgi:hypothetical protein